MDKVASNFNFTTIERIMQFMEDDHSDTTLIKLKNELNKFFINTKCKQVIYTLNTDKLFFGMRVYPILDGDGAMELLGDTKPHVFTGYYLELDSKLFDPMLALDEKELTAILLHEVGHIVYDTETIDEVRKQVDMYFVKTNDSIDLSASRSYKELLAYGLKDSVIKVGSIFSKIGGYDEIISDSFVFSCGYGPYLESAMKKITRSSTFLNKDIDNRLIALSWVLRLNVEFKTRRIPAIKTLNKAKQLTGSKLEERELAYAANTLNRMEDPIKEGNFFDNVKDRFSKKIFTIRTKGIRAVKDDVYELNVRMRCAESEDDLLYVIRTTNTDIAILKDYLTEDISDAEREEVYKILQELYDVRERASKNKEVRRRYDSLIQVVYPEM